MPRTPPIALSHPADEPAVLIGGPPLTVSIFVFLEPRARRRDRDSDETGSSPGHGVARRVLLRVER